MMIYKDYEIDITTYKNLITVFFEGEDLVFDTLEAAQAFIDDIETVYN